MQAVKWKNQHNIFGSIVSISFSCLFEAQELSINLVSKVHHGDILLQL